MKKTLIQFLYEQGIEHKMPHVYLDMDGVLVDLEKGAYGESLESKKKEAELMNSYLNVLSLDRSVNLWAEVAKSKDEDLEPVKGSKTLTKKTQEKITINPMEKDTLRSRR